MRTIYLSLFFVILLYGCASYQKITYTDPYSQVFEGLPGDKNQLFVKANEWMVKTFNDAESVIQYSDKEAGTLMGKYLMYGEQTSGLYGVTTDTRVYAKIDVRVKDNKAMISIEPLGEWNYDPSGFTIYKFGKEECLSEMRKLSESLHKTLDSKAIDF